MASKATLNAAGTAYTLTFDLSGQADSLYDLVVINPDSSTMTQNGAFTVEAAQGPILYGDIIGVPRLRAGQGRVYSFLVGNRGDVDATLVPIIVNFPSYFEAAVINPITPLPPVTLHEGGSFDVTQVPLTYANGDHQMLGLFLVRVPAGSVQTVQILFDCADTPQYAHVPFTISLQVGEPWFDPAIELGDGAPSAIGKHRDSAASLVRTCLFSSEALALDCLSAIFPVLGETNCAIGALQAVTSICLDLFSDNATDETQLISYAQMETTLIVAIADCIKDVGPVAVIINVVQCGFDAYSLSENCFIPALNYIGQTIVSGDPNDLDGSQGDGSAAHYLSGGGPLRYAVFLRTRRPPRPRPRPSPSPTRSKRTWTFPPSASGRSPSARRCSPRLPARRTIRPWSTCAPPTTCSFRSRPR